MKKFAAALIACTLSVLMPSVASAQASRDQFVKIATTLLYLQDYYIDTLDYNKLADIAIEAMVASLDPHTTFLSKQQAEDADETMSGEFEGVGIEFAIIKDTLTVQDVINGGPSSKVGLKAGDKILRVDSVQLAGTKFTNTRVRSLLRGPRGSKVDVEVMRRGVPGTRTYTITRDRIPMESVVAAYEAAPGVVYIKLSRFAQTSPKEVVQAMASLGREPAGVILDLRGNGGGLLASGLSITNLFLSKGQVLVYTEGAKSGKHEEYANGRGIYPKGPLVVMVDENSASASEILAGAIQDWDRGTIVGRRTFGKGLVQRELGYTDGSALRITTARYHTPSGRAIQSPYEEGNSEQYYQEHNERYYRGESFSADSISFDESQKFKTLVKGRTVYGGGGIMPDIFVPRDTSYVSGFYTQVAARSLLQDFVNDYMDARRDAMKKKYSSWKTFAADSAVDAVFDEFLEYAKGRGVNPSEEDVNKSSGEIKLAMKALMARSIWDDNAYYQVLNSEDADYKVALEEALALKAR
ncbi:MAG: PDZ domain-containing protein [Bacteroidales bacterium]|nr:PDZ domain-containing protein [Bacteroidales bacterium]